MDKIKLDFLNEKFAYDLMSVPTYSGMEQRMVSFITLWALKNNVECVIDEYKNVYLIKGKLNDGEFYPCVTSHMDTVQTGHKDLIESGNILEVKTRLNKDNKHEIYVDDMGIGGDDKCGVLVSLSLFKYFDKIKAAFFVSEETGCQGSKNMDKTFFDNVGYVIGWDSPGVNRNAWSCSGQKLFDYKFYTEHMKKVCDNNGRTIFYSEPFTDVVQIRENIDVTCMNFGSGGYNAHTKTEYAVLEDIDVSVKFGKELIEELGNVKYEMNRNQSSYSSYYNYEYKKDENGNFLKDENGRFIKIEKSHDENNDIEKLKNLGDNKKYSGYSYSGSYSPYSKYNSKYNSLYSDEDEDFDDYYNGYSHNTKDNTNDDGVDDEETLKFIMDKYDERIKQIQADVEDHLQDIKENVQEKCKALGIDYETEFKDLIEINASYIFDEEINF